MGLSWIADFDSGVNPFLRPIRKVFLFPDRDDFLEAVNQPLSGLEGVTTMGGADGDRDTRFGDGDRSCAVRDGTLLNRPSLSREVFQFDQFLFRHLVVAFVLQRAGLASSGDSSRRSDKQDHSSCVSVRNAAEQRLRVNRGFVDGYHLHRISGTGAEY